MPLMHSNLNLCIPLSHSERSKSQEDEAAEFSFGCPEKMDSRNDSQRFKMKIKDFDREKLGPTSRFSNNNSDNSNDGVSTQLSLESHSEAESSLKARIITTSKNNGSFVSTSSYHHKSVLKFGVERLLSTNQPDCGLSSADYETSRRNSINSMLPISSFLHTWPTATSTDLRLLGGRHSNPLPPHEISLLAGYGSEYINGHYPALINHHPFFNFEAILQHKMPHGILVNDNLEMRTRHLNLGAQGGGSNEELSLSLNGDQAHGEARRKRSWTRAVFSNLQRKGLEKRFAIQKYITKPDRRQLAATLGLTDAQVKVWFQNRRMKWRHSEMKKIKFQEDQEGTQLCKVKSNRKRNNQSNSLQILQDTNQQVTSSQSIDGESTQLETNYLFDSECSDLDT